MIEYKKLEHMIETTVLQLISFYIETSLMKNSAQCIHEKYKFDKMFSI
jgi:hypothetical protein